MATLAHRVRKQSWHLRVDGAKAAFAARAKFRGELEALLPAFNAAFDAWAPGETMLRIPRLELKLRVASLDELAEALGDALRREMPPLTDGPPATPAADRLRVLLRYLETGLLEWHAAQEDCAKASAALRKTALEELRSVVMRGPADEPLERVMQYYVRLLQLLPRDRWREAAAILRSAAPSRSIEDIETGTTAGGRTAQRPASAPDAVAAIDEVISTRAEIGNRAALVLAATMLAIERCNALPAKRFAREAARALGIRQLERLPAAAARFFPAAFGLSAPKASAASQRPYSTGEERRAVAVHSASAASNVARVVGKCEAARALLQSPQAEAPTLRESPQRFALMTSHAGLVLLHPFLPRLFESCDLYRRSRLLSLPRAGALLHWLATGSDEPYEFELGAVKLLLGLRPETPLPVTAGLVDEPEREEGEALLRAVIEHWSALKRTSIDGLRVSFLQRRGALREDETGWRLQIEPESFDVLLGLLPWGIATVKLPWMTQALHTDWPTP
jgi:hypothetical protein